MTNLAADRLIRDRTLKLVADISRRWPDEYLKPVHADMEYGQYGEAVLNLIAVAYKQNIKLKKFESDEIRDLVTEMSLEDDVKDLIKHLREPSLAEKIEDDESAMVFLK